MTIATKMIVTSRCMIGFTETKGYSVTCDTFKEFCQHLSNFSRPKSMDFLEPYSMVADFNNELDGKRIWGFGVSTSALALSLLHGGLGPGSSGDTGSQSSLDKD